MKKNPRYKDKLLVPADPQTNNPEPCTLPQISGQQRKPMVAPSEKGEFFQCFSNQYLNVTLLSSIGRVII